MAGEPAGIEPDRDSGSEGAGEPVRAQATEAGGVPRSEALTAGGTGAPGTESGRVAQARRAVTERVTRASDWLDGARGRSQAVDSAFVAARRDSDVGGGVLAGAVAYRLFLFLVPLAFFLIFGLGLGAQAVGQSATSAANTAGLGSFIARAVVAGAGESETSRITIFVVAGFATVVGAHSALKVIRVIHALVWGVHLTKMRRPWRATWIFLLVVAAALVSSSAVARLGRAARLGPVAAELVLCGIGFGLWLLISWYMPHAPALSWTALLPGAAFVAVGIVALHIATIVLFSGYLSHKSATYGAVAGSLVLLLWAYLVGRVMIASVVLNAALASRKGTAPPGDA